MEKENIERLSLLSTSMGVSSLEKDVVKVLKAAYEGLADEFVYDRLGSIFAVKKSKNPQAKTLMIASCLDEIGLMVSANNQDGTLQFITLEGISPESLLHQKVKVYTRDHVAYTGVVACRNVNFMDDAASSVKLDQLVIDMGDAAIASLFLPGDLAMIHGDFEMLNDHVAMGKALNHRVCCEAGIEILENLKDVELDYNLAVGCIAQSIVGFRGTMTATYVVKPDTALVLCGFDTANGKPKIERGKGIVMANQDRQMLPSQRLLNDLRSKLSAHQPVMGVAGNDGSFIHKTLKGCPSVALGVALSHTGSSHVMVDLNDVDVLVDEISNYCKQLTSKEIEAFGFGVYYD